MNRGKAFGLGVAVSTGALFFGYQRMDANYEAEMVSDSRDATVAQAFLSEQDEVRTQITDMIAGIDTKIDRFEERLGEGCMLLVLDEEPKNLDDIEKQSKCVRYDEEQLDDIRDLYDDLQDRRTDLISWVEPNVDWDGQEPKLEQTAEDAQKAVDDASHEGRFFDAFDTEPNIPIAAYIEDGEVKTTRSEGSQYDAFPSGILLATVAIGAISFMYLQRKNPN